MPFEVVLTEDAERDIAEICAFIASSDSVASARLVLKRLLSAADSLSALPDRGVIPNELRALGINEFRQVYFKPYRLIYRVVEPQVVIFVIADGRRSLQSLLARRLVSDQGS